MPQPFYPPNAPDPLTPIVKRLLDMAQDPYPAKLVEVMFSQLRSLGVRISKRGIEMFVTSRNGLVKNAANVGCASSAAHARLAVAKQASETLPRWGWGQTVKVAPLRLLRISLTYQVGVSDR